MMRNSPFEIAENKVLPGQRKKLNIPVASLFDYTPLVMPVEVICGTRPGPVFFASAAIHGDELIGVEILKRLLAEPEINSICGTLIVIPIVNPFGYNNTSRYLPDRRDLNRCFPGAANGSLAARIAHIFIHEIVAKCDYGIDIHSGALHRFNIPQIRVARTSDIEEMNLAKNFGAPIILASSLREGTLRKTAESLGVKTLLYEAGEALRFDEQSIKLGVKGIFNVMRTLGMLPGPITHITEAQHTIIAKDSHWIRAQQSGSLRALKEVGARVEAGEVLGVISDPYGDYNIEVKTQSTGIIIAAITMPLVNWGNALFHIATTNEISSNNQMYGTNLCNIVRDQDADIENEGW
jgi:predicted deacylase